MTKYVLRIAAVAAALFVVSASATTEATQIPALNNQNLYTFGRLKGEAGGVIAKDVNLSCTQKVQDNLKAEIIETRNGTVVSDQVLWGAAAQQEAEAIGAPIEVADDGIRYNVGCAQYSGNVYFRFLANGQDFWLQSNSSNFHNNIEIDDPRIGWDGWGTGWVILGKNMGCPGHNEWGTSVGTGGGSYDGSSWSWAAYITYFKSW